MIKLAPAPQRRVIGDLADLPRLADALGVDRMRSSTTKGHGHDDTCPGVTRISAGQVGIDHILSGGLPSPVASTLVSGTSGSGKTVFALQFLAKGIAYDGEGAVFVTFEEPPEALRQHGESLGYDIARARARGPLGVRRRDLRPHRRGGVSSAGSTSPA